MVRQRQADLLLIAATVIAACGWIFSREAIAGMPVFAFLGLRFSSPRCFCCRSAAVFARKSSTGQNSSSADSGLRSTSACGSHSVSTTASLGEGAFIMSLSMMSVPLTAWVMMECPPRAWWECLPIAVVGLGLLSLHMPIAFHPSQGWFC